MGVQPFTFVDLFAGVGGFHHALSEMGGECVLAVEADADCRSVYGRMFPDLPPERFLCDIRSITRTKSGADRSSTGIKKLVPSHDVLCAGFPCQPFSKSGTQTGLRDQTRGTLFFDVMEIVRARKPSFVILENVRNLAGPRHRGTWTTILDSLRAEGYIVDEEPLVLSPHRLSRDEGGAPQVRDRVFILAHRTTPLIVTGRPLLDRMLTPGLDPDNEWAIEDYLDSDSSIAEISNYQLTEVEIGWVDAWQAFVERINSDWLPGFPIWADAFRRVPQIPDGTPEWKVDFLTKNSKFYNQHRAVIDDWLAEPWGPEGCMVEDFPASRRKFEWQARKAQPTKADRDLWKLVLQFRPSGIRVKAPTYLPALVAITQTSVIGSRRRRITPREAAKLQGFEEDILDAFENTGVGPKAAYKQLGNAVNVGVVKVAAAALFARGRADFSYKDMARRTPTDSSLKHTA